MSGEVGIGFGRVIIILVASYFVIKWGVKNGIKQYYEEKEQEKKMKKKLEEYHNENDKEK